MATSDFGKHSTAPSVLTHDFVIHEQDDDHTKWQSHHLYRNLADVQHLLNVLSVMILMTVPQSRGRLSSIACHNWSVLEYLSTTHTATKNAQIALTTIECIGAIKRQNAISTPQQQEIVLID